MKTILSLVGLFLCQYAISQNYSRIQVFTDSRGFQTLAEMGIGIDHGTIKKDYSFTSDFSQEEIQLIQSAGYTYKILIADLEEFYVSQNLNESKSTVPTKNIGCSGNSVSAFTPTVPSNFQLGSMGGFYTYQQFLNELDSMASKYPNLISVRDTINSFTSIQNRPIYWVKISNNPNTDEAEPEVLYTAVHHAREPNSLSEVIFYMWYLLENYATTPEVAYLVDNTEMYFVPMVNPDGYVHNQTTNPNGGGMWRKNRRLNSGGSYGVDLNRNYSYGWGTTGTSASQSNDTYCGTAAFSEPETQAIKWFCENRDFKFAFNAHTYGNDILFPIGATTSEFADDHDYFDLFTGHMTHENDYGHMKSSSLYPASGDSDDYMYKMDLALKPKIFAMTPEVSNTSGGFWPASNQITGICQEMVFPNLVLSHLTHRYLEVTDTDPSMIGSITGTFNHNALRLGQENGPVTVSITPLAGIQSVGSPVVHDLAIMQNATGNIAYTLLPTILFGDEIKYVLNTEYVGWTKHDTIVKQFGAITPQILDQATTAVNWTGNWGITTTTFVSPSSSFTDTPVGNYTNNTTQTFQYTTPVDLTNTTAAMIRFYAKWDIEANYDYCQFQVSTDNGTSWIGQCGNYTVPGVSGSGSVQPNGQPVYEGTQSAWVQEEISLSDYLGETINLRFILRSDGGSTSDGFYFDDFEVLYNIDFTGIEEHQEQLFHVVPNPANDQVSLHFDTSIENGELSILTYSGQLVKSEKVEVNQQVLNLNTSDWNSGVYYLQFVSDQHSSRKPVKLIVVH